MILDWFCPRCRCSGTAVALKAGEQELRLEKSHRAVWDTRIRRRRLRGRWGHQIPLNKCHGGKLQYSIRLAVGGSGR